MSDDAISLRRCEWLLKQRGCRMWRESEIGQELALRNSVPDFLAEAGGQRFLVEMKSFEQDSVLDRLAAEVTTFTLSPMTLQKRVNRLVRDAAEQMAPYVDLGIPIIIGLDNWRQKGVHCDKHSLTGLFGELQVVMKVDPATGTAIDEGWGHASDHSPLCKGNNAHISAVFCLISGVRFDADDGPRPFEQERKMKVRLVRNPFATTTLPPDIFGDREDEIFEP